jgi:hypothetical protein
MAASDYALNFFKNRLHLAGRPQMSTRPNLGDRRRESSRDALDVNGGHKDAHLEEMARVRGHFGQPGELTLIGLGN